MYCFSCLHFRKMKYAMALVVIVHVVIANEYKKNKKNTHRVVFVYHYMNERKHLSFSLLDLIHKNVSVYLEHAIYQWMTCTFTCLTSHNVDT